MNKVPDAWDDEWSIAADVQVRKQYLIGLTLCTDSCGGAGRVYRSRAEEALVKTDQSTKTSSTSRIQPSTMG